MDDADRDPAYVQGFLAVVGGRGDAADLTVPAGLGLTRVQTSRRGGMRTVTFGSTVPTVTFRTDGLTVLVKGRPFPLRATNPMVPLPDDGSRVDAFLEDLDGKFAIFAMNGSGRAFAATDLLAAGPIYHAQVDGCLFVGTHLGVLVGALPRVPAFDRVGIASQLLAAGPVAGITPFEGIRRLGAAECLEIGVEQLDRTGLTPTWRVRRYAEVAATLAAQEESVAEASAVGGVDDRARTAFFGTLLERSLERELAAGGPAVVMLSGGRDSRAIALSLRASGRAVQGVTYGLRRSTDVVRSRRLASDLGIAHEVVPYDDWRYEDFAPRIVELGGGASGLQTAHTLAGFVEAGRSHRSVLTGYLGDSATGNHLRKHGDVTLELAAGAVLRTRGSDGRRIASTFGPEVQMLLDDFAARWHALGGVPAHRRLMLLNLTMRNSGFISGTFDLCESVVEVGYPFHSRALLAFALHLPESDLRGRALYDRWIGATGAGLGVRPAVPPRAQGGWHGRLAMWIGRRRHGPPVEREDWARRIARSRAWLDAQVSQCVNDDLRRIADDSLRSPRTPTTVPLALLALSMDMAARR